MNSITGSTVARLWFLRAPAMKIFLPTRLFVPLLVRYLDRLWLMVIGISTCHTNTTTHTSGGKYTLPSANCLLTFARNIGILLGFLGAFLVFYIFAAEHAKPPRSKGEVLVFRKGRMPPSFDKKDGTDAEAQATGRPVVAEKGTTNGNSGLAAGASVFHWEDLCYDIQIKGKDRRLLDHVDGWVKPGLSTALMVSFPSCQYRP
jgi:hypothetical protein